MATRLTMLSFISVAFAFYFLAAFPFAAQGYTITYYQQDNGTTSPVTTYAPSVFWGGACTTTVFGYSTGRDSDGSYSVLSQYFSPDMTEKATSSYSYTANQTCKLQTTTTGLNFSTPLNGFYENAMKTTFTASMSQESYMKVVYDCEPDSSEWFRYYNTWNNDSYSNMPFGYLDTFTTCFKQSPADCGNTLANELGNISNYINARYKPCGAGMRAAKDVRYTSPSCGSVVSDATANFWTMVPFNSGAAGRVNVSIYNAYAYGSSGYTPTYQFYIYDVATNTTIVNLGTSLGSSTQTLEKNKDYWLLLGVRVAVDNLNCGSGNILVGLQWINYSLAAWAYEPDFSCFEWDNCDTKTNTRSRICTDLNGKVPIEIQTEACTATTDTVFNKTLGFEYGYDQDVYVCSLHNPGLYLPCQTDLFSYKTQIPDNWTNFAAIDIIGIIMENTAKLTNIYGAVDGINALMLRYIPPKQYEPVVNPTSFPYPPTVCGNKSVGSNGEVSTPYNNESYVGLATNITLSVNPQISWYSKKCPYSETQYDTTADAFIFGLNASCGKMFYDGSADGNKAINGDYRMTVQGWQNVTHYVSSVYTAVAPVANITFNTSVIDGNVSDVILFDHIETPYGIIINTSGNSFKNGTIMSFYLETITPGDIGIFSGADIYTTLYGSVSIAGTGWFNITLNVPSETNIVYVLSGAGMEFYVDFIGITNPENFTTEYINFPFGAVATDEWVKTTVPLSHLGLQDNGLYTIFLGVTSKTGSSVYPNPSCVLFDDFQIQNSATVLIEETCTSGCNKNKKYIKGEWTGSYCLRYEYPAYSDNCLTSGEQTVKSTIETCNYTQDWYCTEDGVYHIFDCTLKVWEDRVNTTLCSTTVIDQAESNQTESILGDLFDIGAFSFLLSPFMIIMYIGLILAGIITFYTEAWELGALAIVMVLVGGTFGGLVPAWILFTIVISVVALIAYRFAAAGG